MTKTKILVVGQTPPPYGGQAMMIESMLSGKYDTIELFHVRMAFSKEMNEIGKVKTFKIFHLFEVVFRIICLRFTSGAKILYYPPTGPNKVPFFRDAFILILVRPFFKKTCFHFHASGIAELYPSLNFLSKFLFRAAYYNADLGIKLSEASPNDYDHLAAKNKRIVSYGIEDRFLMTPLTRDKNIWPVILFVGLLTESKGVMILIEACHLVKKRGLNFFVNIVGKFESLEFEKAVKQKVISYGLTDNISFKGVLIGNSKFETYANSDIFCFPTFFEAESFPVVLLEASCFELPIVSSQWRGVPSLVEDQVTGFLCTIKNPECIADKLALLIEQPEMRRRLGKQGRMIFLQKYSLRKFHENIERTLSSLR